MGDEDMMCSSMIAVAGLTLGRKEDAHGGVLLNV